MGGESVKPLIRGRARRIRRERLDMLMAMTESTRFRNRTSSLLVHGLILVCLGCLATLSRADEQSESAAKPAVAAKSDAVRKCGLGAAFHGGRRQALLAKLEHGVVLVRGLPTTREYTRFSQDKTFWYLTGVESPNVSLLMDAKSGKQILFLPPANATAELWEGEIWDASDAWIGELTGFKDVRPSNELMSVLKEWTANEKTVWISKEPHVELSGCHDRALPFDRRREKDPFDGRASREDALEDSLKEKLQVEVKDMSPVMAEMRRVKTPEELDAMRRAGRAGAVAMLEAMHATKPGIGEWEIDALMTFVHRREGADGPAYYSIVGSGPNALVLHYSACSRTLQPHEMLLVDYAPEVDHYTSDITRTWPTDGAMTPRMTELYDAVLSAQEAGIAAVKPGKTMQDIDKACRKVLQTRGFGKLMPHGACHYIGLEVHDVGDNSKPLEPGVCLTVEPGVYEAASGIGIRIEDVVAVTESGCEVLSGGVPKDRKTVVEAVGIGGTILRENVHAAEGPDPRIQAEQKRR
jgi:Xaa-Pro aminopeptidase